MTNEEFVSQISDAQTTLYRVAKSILKNDEDCADAIQNAVLKAFDKIGTLKQEKYFRTWLTRILIHECYQIMGKKKEQVPYEEYMEKKEDSLGDSEVFYALMELDEMYRVPFTLHYIEGYSTKEIAKILDISISNVKIRLSRARAKLQERLEG